MSINSRDALIDYCFHRLGAPVIEVELDEQQVSYCVDDAVQRWQQVHSDGSIRKYVPHTITEDDIKRGYIRLPDTILSVVRVLPVTLSGVIANTLSGMGMFNPVYQYSITDFKNVLNGEMSSYNDLMTNIQMAQDLFHAETGLQFNRLSSKLYLETDYNSASSLVKLGTIIVVECYMAIEEDEAPRMWSDWWLKRYAAALMKRQWGTNLKKFDGVQLPGGITTNGQIIYGEALQEIEELEHELRDQHELPPIFMVG